MFLLGIDMNHQSDHGTVVIIEKKLKNVRHCYTVRQVDRIPSAVSPHAIAGLYRDARYITRKRVFSQDRRPKKEVNAHPVIVATVTGHNRSLIDAVREADIPVEALFLTGTHQEEAPGATAPVKPGLGRNLSVSASMLFETVITVAAQQRLKIEADTPEAGMLISELKGVMAGAENRNTAAMDGPGSLLPALAAPLWYRENIRYRQVYRTSSTCVRQYK